MLYNAEIIDYGDAFAALDIQRLLLGLPKRDPIIMTWFHDRGIRGWEWAELEDLRELWRYLHRLKENRDRVLRDMEDFLERHLSVG